jgi:hypothetical protein
MSLFWWAKLRKAGLKTEGLLHQVTVKEKAPLLEL